MYAHYYSKCMNIIIVFLIIRTHSGSWLQKRHNITKHSSSYSFEFNGTCKLNLYSNQIMEFVTYTYRSVDIISKYTIIFMYYEIKHITQKKLEFTVKSYIMLLQLHL